MVAAVYTIVPLSSEKSTQASFGTLGQQAEAVWKSLNRRHRRPFAARLAVLSDSGTELRREIILEQNLCVWVSDFEHPTLSVRLQEHIPEVNSESAVFWIPALDSMEAFDSIDRFANKWPLDALYS